jgi:predicted nucleic acid-binding protein
VTVYLDTSSLVKLFLEEAGSDEVRTLVRGATIATSVVAYPEARATFARRRREGLLSPAALAAAKRALDAAWSSFAAVEVTFDVARHAGDLAERHRLRGFDSVHLACFDVLARQRGFEAVQFSSFDDALDTAAASLRRSARS